MIVFIITHMNTESLLANEDIIQCIQKHTSVSSRIDQLFDEAEYFEDSHESALSMDEYRENKTLVIPTIKKSSIRLLNALSKHPTWIKKSHLHLNKIVLDALTFYIYSTMMETLGYLEILSFANKNISSKEMDYIEKDFHITKTLLDLASKKTYPEMLYFIGNIEEPFRNILIQKISRTVEI